MEYNNINEFSSTFADDKKCYWMGIEKTSFENANDSKYFTWLDNANSKYNQSTEGFQWDANDLSSASKLCACFGQHTFGSVSMRSVQCEEQHTTICQQQSN